MEIQTIGSREANEWETERDGDVEEFVDQKYCSRSWSHSCSLIDMHKTAGEDNIGAEAIKWKYKLDRMT